MKMFLICKLIPNLVTPSEEVGGSIYLNNINLTISRFRYLLLFSWTLFILRLPSHLAL